MRRRPRSLETRVIVVMSGAALSVTLLVGAALYLAISATITRGLVEDAESISGQVARSLGRPLYELSDSTAVGIAEAYLAAGTLVGVRIDTRASGRIVDVAPTRETAIPIMRREITYDRFNLGTVTLWFSDTRLVDTQRRLLVSVTAIIGSMLVAFMLSVRLASRRVVGQAFDGIIDGIERISEGTYSHVIPDSPFHEVSGLIWTLNGMTQSILEKDRELRAANRTLEARVEERTRELEESFARLREANKRLSVAEKILALGTLVTGVSHEINTPLGIAVTAASYLEQELARAEVPGTDGLVESVRLLRRNLERAARVVDEFRKVAGGQIADEVTEFCPREVIDETIASLAPRLERNRLDVRVSGEGVRLRSHPSALWPIITNLLVNAMVHAYPGSPGGRVDIVLATSGGGIRIDVRDYGVGMEPDVRRRVFEPFFTTRRGTGGMGLGLYVVYATVTEKLGGTIELETAPGEGSRYVIDIPSLPARTDGAIPS